MHPNFLIYERVLSILDKYFQEDTDELLGGISNSLGGQTETPGST